MGVCRIITRNINTHPGADVQIQFSPKHGRYRHRRMVASERPRRDLSIDASFGGYTTLSPLSRKPAIYISITINIVERVKEILQKGCGILSCVLRRMCMCKTPIDEYGGVLYMYVQTPIHEYGGLMYTFSFVLSRSPSCSCFAP